MGGIMTVQEGVWVRAGAGVEAPGIRGLVPEEGGPGGRGPGLLLQHQQVHATRNTAIGSTLKPALKILKYSLVLWIHIWTDMDRNYFFLLSGSPAPDLLRFQSWHPDPESQLWNHTIPVPYGPKLFFLSFWLPGPGFRVISELAHGSGINRAR